MILYFCEKKKIYRYGQNNLFGQYRPVQQIVWSEKPATSSMDDKNTTTKKEQQSFSRRDKQQRQNQLIIRLNGIIFHPDLLRGTSLNKTIKNYTFFSYEINEALHVSEEEQGMILDCLKIIRKELEHGIDKHGKNLIVTYIELLLGFCMRFYERQFITHENKNKIILGQTQKFYITQRLQRQSERKKV